MKTLTIQTVVFKRTRTSLWEDGVIVNDGMVIVDMDGHAVTALVWAWDRRDVGMLTVTGEGGADHHMRDPVDEGHEIALSAIHGEISVEAALAECCLGEARSLRLSCSCGAHPATGSVDPDTAKQLSQIWLNRHPAPEHRARVEYPLPQRTETKIGGE